MYILDVPFKYSINNSIIFRGFAVSYEVFIQLHLSTFTLEEATLLLFDVFLGVFLGLSMFIYFCYAGRITL